jgi:hypothetical protein
VATPARPTQENVRELIESLAGEAAIIQAASRELARAVRDLRRTYERIILRGEGDALATSPIDARGLRPGDSAIVYVAKQHGVRIPDERDVDLVVGFAEAVATILRRWADRDLAREEPTSE